MLFRMCANIMTVSKITAFKEIQRKKASEIMVCNVYMYDLVKAKGMSELFLAFLHMTNDNSSSSTGVEIQKYAELNFS